VRDYDDREIKVGSRVAYNLSGSVALGTVILIENGPRTYSGTTHWVLIAPDRPWAKLASKKGYSKVKVYDSISMKVDKITVVS
jgi:hypothetical protein